MVGLFGKRVGGVGCLKCWFDQVDVYAPEFTEACSYNICLWVCGIDVKVFIVSEFSVKVIVQVLSATYSARPCCSRLLIVLSGGGIVEWG